jgi:hypothetical protein
MWSAQPPTGAAAMIAAGAVTLANIAVLEK